MGIDFSIQISDIDEVINHRLKDIDLAIDISKQKSISLSKNIQQGSILITADTIVLLKNTIMQKPKNKHDAINMLKQLSGNIHKVITGVCITSKNKQ